MIHGSPENVTPLSLRAYGSSSTTAQGSMEVWRFQITTQWKESETTLFPKNDQREDIANYRAISLLSVGSKTFTKIIHRRNMERILDDYQPVEQASLRKNVSRMGSRQAIIQLIETSCEYHLPIVPVFAEYKKAFDPV
ncbi:hypothetical protein ANCCEY_00648 [Ancylostoma ceylanicum]|uniref:Reverse transcriptase domain-containing protein n=1 Tax=Ancylostoma ceylanicum TaxID=53326 RepID=A0A0D6MBD2_9BILA|nr:hypothetical protein ANCCEY_00648 [Ancylostoma ceylanicum]